MSQPDRHPRYHHDDGERSPNFRPDVSIIKPEDSLSHEDQLEAERHEFLRYLPPEGTTVCSYSGPQAMQNTINNRGAGHYIVFTDIPPPRFKIVAEDLPGRIDYSIKLETLIIKTPSAPHELATGTFKSLLTAKAVEMGVSRLIRYLGSTREETPDRAKEANASWAPRHRSSNRTVQWPTVALEAGYSDTKQKLENDIAFWLNGPNGKANIGITIDVKRPSGDIYICTWQQGVPATRGHPNPLPRKLREVKITRANPPMLVGGPLTIPFSQLLLRSPAPPEKDFVFVEEDLLYLADEIWEGMRGLGHLP